MREMDNFVPPAPVAKVVEAARAAVGPEAVDYRFTVFPPTNGDGVKRVEVVLSMRITE